MDFATKASSAVNRSGLFLSANFTLSLVVDYIVVTLEKPVRKSSPFTHYYFAVCPLFNPYLLLSVHPPFFN